jgi:methionine-rich copper-binding protein CopC
MTILPRRIPLHLALGVLVGVPATAALHTHLVKAEPGVEAVVNQAPKRLRLWFSEAPEVALSSATLLKPDNTPVATVKLGPTEDSLAVGGPITVDLAPGKYVVLWRTGSRDGHAVRGRYSFTYDPAAPATPP